MRTRMLPRAAGTLAAATAAALALTLTAAAGSNVPAVTTHTSGNNTSVLRHAPSVSAAEVARLRQYLAVPAHRAEFNSLLERSFEQAGIRTGTSSFEVPGRVSLDLAYGVTGYHVWAILSFADVYDGAVSAMIAGCTALLYRYHLNWFAWVCGWMGTELASWSAGRAWAANHGVWLAVYWYPWIYYQGGYW